VRLVFAPPRRCCCRESWRATRARPLLTGETIPRGSRSLGIVNRVFPEATFAGDADAWIARLLDLSGSALRLAKQSVVAARGLALDEGHRAVERIYLEQLMRTEDAQEGLRAFLEKRAPVWRHR
jgi:cyclohexa-1,5-dienecarbonyl-CoA hydratase